jgi:hypothetical protein
VKFKPADFMSTPLGQLMAYNAADGAKEGVASLPQAQQVFKKAKHRFAKQEKTFDGFLRAMTEVCFGKERPFNPSGPLAPEFAKPERTTCSGLGAEISTVVGAGTICRLMSAIDRARLADVPFGIDIPASFPNRSGDYSWIERLGRLADEDRRFDIAAGKNHGRPLVWFTRKEEVDDLRSHPRAALEFADLLRDHLGLIHHGPTLDVGAASTPNHLFLLHYPAAVAVRAGHWRPSFVEGIDNRRFKAHRRAKKALWGGTIDLDGFRPGGSERVLLSLQAERLVGGEKILAEYIGAVTSRRGTLANVDDDEAFVRHVSRKRSVKSLVDEICGVTP